MHCSCPQTQTQTQQTQKPAAVPSCCTLPGPAKHLFLRFRAHKFNTVTNNINSCIKPCCVATIHQLLLQTLHCHHTETPALPYTSTHSQHQILHSTCVATMHVYALQRITCMSNCCQASTQSTCSALPFPVLHTANVIETVQHTSTAALPHCTPTYRHYNTPDCCTCISNCC